MSQRVPIEGSVARILNLHELAINRGSDHGVYAGMIFDVLDPKAENITDPDTAEVLGSVYRPKVQVKVFAIEERLCLARTFKSTRTNIGGSGLGGFAKAFEPPKWVERDETLKTNESTWQDLDESESIVKTGDPVVEAIQVDGEVEASGSRTLDFAETARQLEHDFASWLAADGWDVNVERTDRDRRVDILAQKENQILIVEAKARRNPLGPSDLAQAIGWMALYPEVPGKELKRILVVGESGLAKEARDVLKSRPDLLEVYQVKDEGGFERIDMPTELEEA